MRLITTLTLVVILASTTAAVGKNPKFDVTVVEVGDDGLIDEESAIFTGAPIDIDLDGDLDYLMTVFAPGTSIGGLGEVDPVPPVLLRNDGGKWVPATNKHIKKIKTEAVLWLLVGDLDGDGRSDVFGADTGPDNEPFHGAPNLLAFGNRRDQLRGDNKRFPGNPSAFTNSAAMADVDGDGSLDIFEGNTIGGGSQTLPRVLFNDGRGHFETRAGTLPSLIPGLLTSPVDENFANSDFVDVDLDGDPDLVLGGHAEDYVLRNENGVFEVAEGALPEHAGGATFGFASGNFNRDEWPDLIWTWDADGTGEEVRVAVYLNQGDGTYEVGPKSWLPKKYRDNLSLFAVADLNGDGLDDLAAQDFPNPHIVLINRKGRRFKQLKKPFTGDAGPGLSDSCCARAGAADFDGDGDIDLAYLDGFRFFYAENVIIDD